MTDLIDELNQTAAIAARDGVQSAIESLESRIKITVDNKHPASSYFASQLEQDKAAIAQLKQLRAYVHKRVFDAYIVEQKEPRSEG